MNSEIFKKKVEEILKDPSSYGFDECVLCHKGPIVMMGIYFPSEEIAQRINQPEGQHRVILYPMCEKCATAGDPKTIIERVEKRLVDDLDAGDGIRMIR